MSSLTTWFAGRPARWLDRFASSFVTETVTDDGTRVFLALDPSCHGLDMVMVVNDVRHPESWTGDPVDPGDQDVVWHVPDDIRSLF
jgi:hypothetical protein